MKQSSYKGVGALISALIIIETLTNETIFSLAELYPPFLSIPT
jgi:hypothetical protein